MNMDPHSGKYQMMILFLISCATLMLPKAFSHDNPTVRFRGLFSSAVDSNLNAFAEFVVSQFKRCDANSITIIFDETKINPLLNKLLDFKNIQFLLFNLNNFTHIELKKSLFDLYHNQGQTSFIIIVDRPVVILDIAEEIFQENRRGAAAIMPHKSQWLVWVWQRSQEEKLTQQQRQRSSMDNVAVVFLESFAVDRINVYPPGINSFRLQAYEWTTNRTKITRQIESVNANDNANGSSCVLFPNKVYGMNRRHLQVIGFVYMSRNYLDFSDDPGKGSSGYKVDHLAMLARVMNFTYSTKVSTELGNMPKTIRYGGYDFSLGVFSTTTKYEDIDVTFPLYFERLRGMYKRPRKTHTSQSVSTFLILPFPAKVCLIIALALFSTAVMWLGLESITFHQTHAGHDNLALSKVVAFHSNDPIICNPRVTFKVKLFQFFSMVYVLTAVVFNQGNLPPISRMSTRIVVWSWCATMLIYYASYTGFLTSQMVGKTVDIPFNTFEEMMANGNFQWGTLKDDGKMEEIFNNSNDSVLKRLGEKLIILDDEGDIDESRRMLFDRLNGPFVFIYYETFVSSILGSGDYHLVKESVFTMNRGLSVPKGSELEQLLSPAILQVYDSGLNEHLLSKYNLTAYSHGQGSKHCKANCQASRDQTIGIPDIVCLLLLSIFFLAISFMLLAIEILLPPAKYLLKALRSRPF